jgi:hypothetical protein
MSIKDLFNNKPTSYDTANSSSIEVESYDYILQKNKQNNEFVPRLDFSSASNFVFYGSAEEYYKSAIERIYNFYPYDGSKKEKIEFSLSSSYIDDWLYKNKYPKTVGHIQFSHAGWGSLSTKTNGFGLPNSKEYIYSRGGLHTASAMADNPLYKTFNKSVKYESEKNRTTNYRMNTPDGMSVEFWLKKESFEISKTEKEVILDLWNGELSSSSDYGRMTIALTSSAQADGSDTFILTMHSGTVGFSELAIGTNTITTGSLSSWHHYALTFTSASSGINTRIYLDGILNDSKTLGTSGMEEIEGLVNAYIGALQTSPSSSNGALTQDELKYSGKLSASLDDFRYWKTLRSSKQILDNWNRSVGAGTNSDDANVNLGVYYKFNEGVVGTDVLDSVVLDYSGRIVNGTWVGYSSGARNITSAIELYDSILTEEKDPIIYSAHPEVVALKTEMLTSGSLYDQENGNMLINKIPSWMVDSDQENNNHLKYLTQIIASYMDKLNAQISQLKNNKFAEYHEGEIKPLPFAKRLLEDRGFITSDILVNSEVLEYFEKRNKSGEIYEKDLFDIKNLIYQNIYNNLDYILKSKGTEESFRNLIRCFGIDDEILKINRYTDKGTHYFTDKVKHTSVYKKLINHNKSGAFDGTIFQTSSAQNSLTFISGSSSDKKEKNNAMTFEINLVAPRKALSSEDEYISFPYFSSSIGGFHQAKEDENDYGWNTSDDANLQIYFIRESIDSNGGYFQLNNYDNSIFLTSSYFREVYNDHNWTVAAKIKPVNYPYSGIKGSPEEPTYTLEFFGVHHRGDVLVDSFSVSSSLSYALGSSYLSERKRIYTGAHWLNYTTSPLVYSDLSIGTCRFYLDYLEDEVLEQHNKDIKNYGTNKTFEGSALKVLNTSNKKLSSAELLILNWDFETVTGSDSNGCFIVEDISSGSTESKYGFLDNIVNTEHRAKGYGFGSSDTSFLKNSFMYAAKKELPEISYTADDIQIKDEDQKVFIEDLDVSDNFYTFEKSMYQVISEEMLNTLSSVTEMNNLIGKVVDRYRFNYKNLDYMKRIFFEKVEQDPDLDRFTEYFKWIDKSIYSFLEQLIPASARYNSKISDTIESHIFERNKVRSLIPNKFVDPTPDDHINGIRELDYNWKYGHAPLPTSTINASFSNISFTANHNGGAHQDFLAVTASGQTHLSLYADPNQALTIDPSTIDHLIYTGSTGLAFKAKGVIGGASGAFAQKSSGYTLTNDSTASISFRMSGSGENDIGTDTVNIILRDSSGNDVYSITAAQNFQLFASASGGSDTGTYTTNHITADGWVHYAIVFNDANIPVLYKNASPVSQSGFSAQLGTAAAVAKLVVFMDEQTAFQDIVIWNKLLTPADVSKLYNNGIWLNPTSVSSSQINDWYKYGYEDYWTGSAGDNLSVISNISSSFSAGTKKTLAIQTSARAEQFQFTLGDNPFNTSKSEEKIYEELTSSLNTKFLSIYGETTKTGTGPDVFTIQSASMGNNTTISSTKAGTGFFTAAPTVTNGINFSQVIPQNTQCLWRREREARTDIPERESIRKIIENDNNQKANTLVDNDGNTYQGSTYAIRRLSRVYKEGVSMVRSLHGGINYEIQKNRRISKNAIETHSELISLGTPKNIIVVGTGTGQGLELKPDCVAIENPNVKQKFNVQAFLGKFAVSATAVTFAPFDDSTSFIFGLKGALVLPFNIFSGSIDSGYNKDVADGYRSDAYITNLHSDTVSDRNDVPMQGPFTKRWVGGHQSRHQDINRYDPSLIDGQSLAAPKNNLHNLYTRAEGYRLLLAEGAGDGALGLTDPQYGVTGISGHPRFGKYPDIAKKKAVLFREETAKRPVNIKNIQTTTASYSHGNYREQYEVLSVASGKENNNPLFRSIADTHQYLPSAIENILPQTTNYHTLIGVSDHPSGNVFGVGESSIMNNEVDAYNTPVISSITFDLEEVSSISHTSNLELTAGATTYLAETRDPNSTVTKTTVPDKIMYTGSSGLGIKNSTSDNLLFSTGTNSDIGTNNYSVSFWLWHGDAYNDQIIYFTDAAGQIRHQIQFDNAIKVYYENDASTTDYAQFITTISSDTNEWNHYTVHFNVSDLSSGTPRLWKNSVEINGSGYTTVGGTTPNLTRTFVSLDDLMGYSDVIIWDKLLTQEDIDIIYAKGNWINPRTHPSSSNIIDWYKFGYEDYWATAGFSNGDTLDTYGGTSQIISSSFGTGNNNLLTTVANRGEFMYGLNPFGTSKTDSEFWDELESSLTDSFTDLTVSYTGTGPAAFNLVADSAYDITAAASEDGSDFSSPVAINGVSLIIETGYINTTSRATGSIQKSVFSTRFSAPGGIETMTYGFLDAYNHEKSAYNALPYRNLPLRSSGSGESGTIRLDDHLGNRHGLITHLSRHSGKFGADSVYGSVTAGDYVTTPSYHKIPRNTARKAVSGSSLSSPTFNLDHDNFFIVSSIPRSDYQYSWVTSSLGSNYSINSGKQRMFGYAPRDGIMSSSYEVHGETGYVGAITFPTASEIFGV